MTVTEKITDTQGKRGQVTHNAADVYETFFIPALFEQWPPATADLLQVKPGERVLDVACGTGILARHFAERVGDENLVCGVDINEGMLAVAKRRAPGVQWRQGHAEALPYENDGFDCVACQFGLMFFENRHTAIQEMMRVLKPGRKLAISVWDKLENTPGYAAMTTLLQELFGNTFADELRAPFILGEEDKFAEVIKAAGVHNFTIHTIPGMARFPSLDDWIYTDIKGWTLADMIDDAQFQRLSRTAHKLLKQFTDGNGTISFEAPAHIAVISKT
ncbi:class I SAM-dependent methyltransferase [Kaarinaea lacus]